MTAVSVVFLNLLHGVMIGLALAIALTGWRVIRARVEAEPVGEDWRVTVEGACTFLALPRLTRVLASIPAGTDVDGHHFGRATSIMLRIRRLPTGSDSTKPRVARFGSMVWSRPANSHAGP